MQETKAEKNSEKKAYKKLVKFFNGEASEIEAEKAEKALKVINESIRRKENENRIARLELSIKKIKIALKNKALIAK